MSCWNEEETKRSFGVAAVMCVSEMGVCIGNTTSKGARIG